jgi:hypothetical protein
MKNTLQLKNNHLSVHFSSKNSSWPCGVFNGPLIQNIYGDLRLVQNYHRLAHYCNRADWPYRNINSTDEHFLA